jgi:hypothetical protein
VDDCAGRGILHIEQGAGGKGGHGGQDEVIAGQDSQQAIIRPPGRCSD